LWVGHCEADGSGFIISIQTRSITILTRQFIIHVVDGGTVPTKHKLELSYNTSNGAPNGARAQGASYYKHSKWSSGTGSPSYFSSSLMFIKFKHIHFNFFFEKYHDVGNVALNHSVNFQNNIRHISGSVKITKS
jgi:hypothetical protein